MQAAVVQGASRGIGLALAQRLAEQYGVKQIFATCRDPEGAGALTRLAEFHRGRLQVLALDVLDEDSISSAAASVRAQVERLDLLINCAGLLHAYELNDQCPLGSAASYGVPLPIDRQLTADLQHGGARIIRACQRATC